MSRETGNVSYHYTDAEIVRGRGRNKLTSKVNYLEKITEKIM